MTLPHGGQVPEPDAFDEDSDEHLDLGDIGWDDSLVFIAFWGLAFIYAVGLFPYVYLAARAASWTRRYGTATVVMTVLR